MSHAQRAAPSFLKSKKYLSASGGSIFNRKYSIENIQSLQDSEIVPSNSPLPEMKVLDHN
jgi:hypothetical protein